MSFNRRTPAKTLLLILLIPIASSCEKEGGSQPDPPGTITQNLEVGCGYVVKCTTYAELKGHNIAPQIYTTHIKLYAEQVGNNSAKVKYQVLQ